MSQCECEFDCQDCGGHVVRFGVAAPPVPPRCLICSWLADISDAGEREQLRARFQENA